MTPEELEASRARRRAYMADYRAKNPEKTRESARESMQKFRASNPGVNAARCREQYAKNHDKRRAEAKAKWPEVREDANAKRREHHHAHRDHANALRKENMQKRRATHPWEKLLRGAQARAAKKNLPYSLSREWAEAKWTGHCEITGLAFVLDRQINGPSFWSPSIDRIKPEIGYTPDNCRFVLWAVNALKHDGTDEEMLRVARAIVDNFSS